MATSDISADFPFESKYIEILGSNIHYVDEGRGDPILFLHGNPTSSYLWRNILPYLIPFGRCIAPDLIGMGKSDKPDIEYRFVDHAKYIDGFIENMDLQNLTLVIHDWGSALGFYYAMRNEGNVKGIAFMEAILMPIPDWNMFPEEFKEIFKKFRTPDIGREMIVENNMFVEKILPGAVIRELTEIEMDYYREPFKNPDTRNPLWRWPNEIPIEGEPADVNEIVGKYNVWLTETNIPKLLFYATPGGLLRESAVEWCELNLKKIKTIHIGKGIHFLQEDNPRMIGSELADWYGNI